MWCCYPQTSRRFIGDVSMPLQERKYFAAFRLDLRSISTSQQPHTIIRACLNRIVSAVMERHAWRAASVTTVSLRYCRQHCPECWRNRILYTIVLLPCKIYCTPRERPLRKSYQWTTLRQPPRGFMATTMEPTIAMQG